VAHTYTRTTYIWFVAAAITGIVSGFLHIVRSHLTSGGTESVLVTVLAFGLTAVTAVLIYRGIMVAAYEQDHASRRGRQ
jgi:amino acid transporter